MPEFKIGDRVKVVLYRYPTGKGVVGKAGTVVGINRYIEVDLDDKKFQKKFTPSRYSFFTEEEIEHV